MEGGDADEGVEEETVGLRFAGNDILPERVDFAKTRAGRITENEGVGGPCGKVVHQFEVGTAEYKLGAVVTGLDGQGC